MLIFSLLSLNEIDNVTPLAFRTNGICTVSLFFTLSPFFVRLSVFCTFLSIFFTFYPIFFFLVFCMFYHFWTCQSKLRGSECILVWQQVTCWLLFHMRIIYCHVGIGWQLSSLMFGVHMFLFLQLTSLVSFKNKK